MMRKKFKQIYSTAYHLSSKNHVLLALSGGVDSMVLFDLLRQLPFQLKPNLTLGHINHHLRVESDQEVLELKNWLRQEGYDLHIKDWKPSAHPSSGIEAAGRAFRYHSFYKWMEEFGCDVLMTAHHRSDQAETVLMRLVRGGQWESLQAIKGQQNFRGKQLIRPLLSFSKEQIYHYAKIHQLPFWEDATNAENEYSRNRYRNQILPLLKKENPEVETHLADLAEQMQDLHQISQDLAQDQLGSMVKQGRLSRAAFLKRPAAYQQLLLKAFIEQYWQNGQANLSLSLLKDCISWIKKGHSNSYKELADSHYLCRSYDNIKLSSSPPQINHSFDSKSYQLLKNQWLALPAGGQIAVFESDQLPNRKEKDSYIYVNAEDIAFPLIVNHRQLGDRMTLKGPGRHSKKIKDIFIDQKIPPQKREQAWLVRDKYDNIIWLVNLKESAFSKAWNEKKKQYLIIYRQS